MRPRSSAFRKASISPRRFRALAATALSGVLAATQAAPALASGINNTANAVGTYNGTTSNYGSASVSVPVGSSAVSMSITKTAGTPSVANGTDSSHTDGGDTILYTYTVTNTGNVTMANVVPTDPGPTFGSGTGGFTPFTKTGSLGAFSPASATLAPQASQVFTALYTLSAVDVYHAADNNGTVTNTAGATGTYGPSNTSYDIPTANKATATTTITGNPNLSIAKTYTMKDSGGNTITSAVVGAVVTYSYAVSNIGTVSMTNVKVNDVHEGAAVPLGGSGITNETLTTAGPLGSGASPDTTANDGNWSVLAPGATVTFTWTHTVTQAEFDHG